MPLVLRSSKGSSLSHSEMDENWTFLRDRINALEAVYDLAWNNDGTLKAGKVTEAALQDRIVSTRKRAFASNFYYVSGGTANAMTIANPVGLTMGAYVDGAVFYVKTGAQPNTGPVTLLVDALAALPVVKAVATPLVSGDLPANAVIEVVCSNTDSVFYLTRAVPTATPLITGIDTAQGTVLSTALDVALQKIAHVTLTKPTGSAWKHVELYFSTILERNLGGFAGAEWRIGADVIALKMVGNQEIHAESSDDNMGTTIIAVGTPGTHTADDVITIDLYAREPAATYTAGDDTTSRRLAGTGYYGPA